ncbi:hypothetical protein KEM54_003652 [Ascosphaera aggregata]|nr:hypothetical protein KEM54_003652 [Ascosphaera aggregata]
MTPVVNSLHDVPLENLILYHATDPVLSSVLVFYGPVVTANSTVSSSRIQAYILSPCGVRSYPRITVSPTAPIYAPVHYLPRDRQGDPERRGLAVCLYKYFNELRAPVKHEVVLLAKGGNHHLPRPIKAFEEAHAAELANKMTVIEDSTEIVRGVKAVFRERIVPWVDAHLVLPPQSITLPDDSRDTAGSEDYLALRYGEYAGFISSLGDPIFLPTSRLRRAPSTPKNSNKSKLFKTSQKEALRLAMCEVVDTEERYIGKLYELNGIIHDFKCQAAARPEDCASPDEGALMQLFPHCLDDILAVNMRFLEDVRHVLEVTEKDALDDISSDTRIDSPTYRKGASGKRVDAMGIIPFARALLTWFPKFSAPYEEYMHSHQDFNQLLNIFISDPNSSFSKKVLETGEKKMRSLLMEPVQRLPRYSLLIDAMTNALPNMHPALRTLLKARDVITDICSLDSEISLDNKQKLRRLKSIVPAFPPDMLPHGRLISAIDVYDLLPPFRPASPEDKTSILLLYADKLVVLARSDGTEMKARSLLAYLDKQNPTEQESERPSDVLNYSYTLPVHGLQYSQSTDGRLVFITLPELTTRAFELATAYAGKAKKFIEDLTKARIEDQFPETLRENGKWSLHDIRSADNKLGCLLSLFEEDPMLQEKPSSIRIIFEGTSPIERYPEIDISGVVTPTDRGQYKLEMTSITGQTSTDILAPNELAATLANRLQTYTNSLCQLDSPRLASSLVHTNFSILRALTKHLLEPPKSLKRPKSPSKLLSGIWNGGTSKDQASEPKSSAAEKIGVIGATDTSSKSPGHTPQMSTSRSTTPNPFLKANASFSSLSKFRPDNQHDPYRGLEQTFTAYIICLRSRKGNIIGRILLNRSQADSGEVNELCNLLIEDASRIQMAAEAPVDVLFASFETFMAFFWNESVGPIMSGEALKDLLTKFDTMFPGHFEKYFHRFLRELLPLNRRALAAMVRLLAELLDASGNDGDRGVLTATFAEVLAQDCDAQRCIPLLDRFVEDYDNLFDSVGTVAPFEGPYTPELSCVPGHRPAGSVGSNSSTFRKRFGFGHSKDSAKADPDAKEVKEIKDKERKEFREIKEGKVSSIIRSLSKGKGLKDDEHGLLSKSSFSSKSSLFRSKSTNTDTPDPRLGNLLKPHSKDRTPVQNVFVPPSPGEPYARPHSSHANLALDSIGEEPSSNTTKLAGKIKKKRRSSLSDLTPIPSQSPVAPDLTMFDEQVGAPANPAGSRRSIAGPSLASLYSRTNYEISSLDRSSAVPSRLQRPLSVRELGSPSKSFIPTHQRSNSKKENIPLSPSRSMGRTSAIPPLSPRKRSDVKSSIPTLSPRTTPDPLKWTPKDFSAPPSPTRPLRLRMQNPQKLRERLQTDRNVLDAAEASIQEELMSLTDDIRASSPTRTRSKPGPSTPGLTQSNSLLSRVRGLEAKLSAMTADFQARANRLEKDFQMSLLVSEKRSKQLDALYREASAENSALYERFNGELNKIASEMKLGKGERALQAQLQSTVEELERTRKENMRLKREIGGLRAQQSGFVGGRENDVPPGAQKNADYGY